jgi:hypothetical protein
MWVADAEMSKVGLEYLYGGGGGYYTAGAGVDLAPDCFMASSIAFSAISLLLNSSPMASVKNYFKRLYNAIVWVVSKGRVAGGGGAGAEPTWGSLI